MGDTEPQEQLNPSEEKLSFLLRIRNTVFDSQNARKQRRYMPVLCYMVVSVCFALSIHQLIDEGKLYVGSVSELITMSFLYIPSILYCYLSPLLCRGDHIRTLGSFALRLLNCVLAGLFIAHEIGNIAPCFQSHDQCDFATVYQHMLELAFLLGLATFVFFNRYYPRSNIIHLLFLTHLCSAAIYCYAMTLVFEETYIYKEILRIHDHGNSTDERHRVIRRGFRYRKDPAEECHGALNCLFKEYLEMIYVAMAESLVVAISIIIAFIFDVGRRVGNEEPRDDRPDDENRTRTRSQMFVWTSIVLLAVVFQLMLIVLNVQEADPEIWAIKMIFTIIHVGMIFLGWSICIFFLATSREHNGESRPPLELLDRYLLYFGTAGMLAYTCVVIIHCAYLIPTKYSTKYAIGGLAVNFSSMVQVATQTITILHRDIANNHHAYYPAMVLWIVNFAMFCLDLFDAATLGIYSNPVPHDFNVAWIFFVRGLGPLDVFYRFHCLALIAESIEHHIKERRRETTAAIEQGQENEGFLENQHQIVYG